MLKLFLWLRYLRKRKIVFLSIAAVALSTALLIAVASLFTGFIDAFEQIAVRTIGDVVLSAPIQFAKYPQFIEQLEQIPAVQAATATLSAEGLLHLDKGNVRAVHIWGIEPARRAKVTGFKQFLRKQGQSDKQPSFEAPDSPQAVGGFVGIAVIAEPNEKTDEYDYDSIDQMLGKKVVITTGTIIEAKSPSANGAVSSDTPRFDSAQDRFKRKTIKFTIADIVETGAYELDKAFVYLPIEELQKILYINEEGQLANQIQIKLRDDVQVEQALAEIRGAWKSFAAEQLGWPSDVIRYTAIETAIQMQRKYVTELRKQMGVLLLIFGVVSFSVVVLIFCIFYMIARFKQRDVAIIKSCGMASGSVVFIFLGFGACVGIVGSGLGAVLGYIVTKNINTIEEWIRIIFGLKLWKSSVYVFNKIPNEIDWASAMLIIFLAIVAAAIGAFIPAIVAAKTRPVEILRYE